MTQPTEGNDGLSRMLKRLPTEIEPPHDLWPGVAAAIATERRPRHAQVWAMRIAAALACIAIGTGLGYGLFQRHPATVGPGPTPEAINTWLVKPVMMDAGYQKARMQLAIEFFRRIADLPANDRARVQKGLKQIEDGLRELNDALKSHPDSVLLQQLALGAYQQELEYMRSIASLTQTVSEQTQT